MRISVITMCSAVALMAAPAFAQTTTQTPTVGVQPPPPVSATPACAPNDPDCPRGDQGNPEVGSDSSGTIGTTDGAGTTSGTAGATDTTGTTTGSTGATGSTGTTGGTSGTAQ